jgi:ABC-type transport system involved in cytochrome c biogenesis permease subunit
MDPTLQVLPVLIGVLAATSFAGLISWSRRSPNWVARLLDVLGPLGLLAMAVLWGLRVWSAGHLPLFGTFESSLSLALAVLGVAALFRLRVAGSRASWPIPTGVAAVLLAHGMRYDPTIYALTISERSWVVDVHAVVAWLAFGVLTANAGFAFYLLARRRNSARSAASVEHLLSGSLSLGFLLHTGMLVSGSIYKFMLFGTAWSFDPIETLGLVAWIAYGTLLHLHLMAAWSGRRLAGWCVAVFVLLVVSYRGIVYFPSWSTYHIFDMNLRIHLTGSEGESE